MSAASCSRPVRFVSMRSSSEMSGISTPSTSTTLERGAACSYFTFHATVNTSTAGSSPINVIGRFKISAAAHSLAKP